VELIDTTEKDEEKGNAISYEIWDNIHTRDNDIKNLLPKDRLDPINNRRADPRLIVWEIERPILDPLPPCDENPSKQWLIEQLQAALMGTSNYSLSKALIAPIAPTPHTPVQPQPQFVNDDTCNDAKCVTETDVEQSHEIPTTSDTTGQFRTLIAPTPYASAQTVVFDKDNVGQNDEIPHLWNRNSNSDTTGQGQFVRTELSWPMPEYLSKNDCSPINPPGDGNCLYKSCLICTNDNTTSNEDLRNELNK
jgi:hypothetical protein